MRHRVRPLIALHLCVALAALGALQSACGAQDDEGPLNVCACQAAVARSFENWSGSFKDLDACGQCWVHSITVDETAGTAGACWEVSQKCMPPGVQMSFEKDLSTCSGVRLCMVSCGDDPTCSDACLTDATETARALYLDELSCMCTACADACGARALVESSSCVAAELGR